MEERSEMERLHIWGRVRRWRYDMDGAEIGDGGIR